MLTLRREREADGEQLALRAARSTPSPWSAANYRSSLLAGHRLYLLDDDGEILAQAVVLGAGDEAELLDIVVDAVYQGQGFGRKLLTELMAALSAEGFRRLLLEVRESNARARRLYTSAGLIECGRRRDYYPTADGREPAILMEAVL